MTQKMDKHGQLFARSFRYYFLNGFGIIFLNIFIIPEQQSACAILTAWRPLATEEEP